MPVRSSLPLPPGHFGLPILGESLNFFFDRNFFEKRKARYGSIFKTHILGRPTVVLTGPEAHQFLLASHMDHFSWREGWPISFRELLGESLFLQEGEQHRRNRKLLMPAFHGAALESYLAAIVQITERYLDQWQALETLVWFPELKKLTFEIASTLLIGSQPGDLNARLSQWMSTLSNGLFMPPIGWGWTPYGRALAARDCLLQHIEQVILERQHQPPSRDALGLLMQSEDEQGDRLSLEELKVQALLMLFAGHETTTSMLTSLMLVLGQNADLEAKVRAEQISLTYPLTLDQLRQLPYLDRVLKEVERFYPPVGAGFRGVIKPFEFQGYQVPAGWQAMYPINVSHRDPQCFADPDRFDPDRFSPDRAEHKRYEYSLVGFGGGPRVCLGFAFAQMEMKVVTALILRRFRWQILPHQDLSMNPIPTLKPRSGLKVTLFPNQI